MNSASITAIDSSVTALMNSRIKKRDNREYIFARKDAELLAHNPSNMLTYSYIDFCFRGRPVHSINEFSGFLYIFF